MNALHLLFLFILAIANFSHSYKTPDPPPVPPVQIGGKTFSVQLERVSWFGANEFCRREGMQLASMETQEENNALSNHLMTNVLTSYNFWTSGENFDRSNVWIWLSTGYEALFTDWAEGKPTTNPDHCLALVYVELFGFQWSNFDCYDKNYFVCETKTK